MKSEIGNSKHVRVLPMFDGWSTVGEITITDNQISKEILQQILDIAGQYEGLGNWRPGGKIPGPFGRFKATVK